MKPQLLAAPTIITCHNNADWDALASLIGLLLLYPEGVPVFPGSMDPSLNRFYNDTLSTQYPFAAVKDIDPASVNLVVAADTRQRSRLPHVQAFLDRGAQVHVWDHHPDADPSLQPVFERIERVGATCTLICRELQARDIIPSSRDATTLGLGIYGDTGALTFNSAGPEDFAAVAWLRAHGMDLPRVAELVHSDMTSLHVKALGALLDGAQHYDVGPCSLVLAEAAMDDCMGNVAVLAEKFMEMEPCDALFILGIMHDRIQVVARSRSESIDVGLICKTLGGGGHSCAASASIRNKPAAELKDLIFRRVFAQAHPDKTARDLMSAPAVGIDELQSIREAETIMNRYGLKAAPVFRTGTRQCIGCLECQTASKAIAHGLGNMPATEYMQRQVYTAQPGTSLQRLMDIILGARRRLVPVVENGNVIGVVTRTDLINMFVEEPGRIPLHTPRTARENNLAGTLRAHLPSGILNLLHTAGSLGDRLGVNVYAVGGLVRDLLLGRPAEDFDDVDLVVEGDGIAFGRKLAELLGGRVREHRAFMTALIIYKDAAGKEQRLDVATARLEYYQYPAALPTVELSSIKMDLFRRDFTINAMAVRLNEPKFGRLVDFFSGQHDVQHRIVRVIHSLSFVEDPTRIIRAARFEQRYGFHMGPATEKLVKNALSLQLIDKISGQRLLHELALIFNEAVPQAGLARLNELGVLEAVHPALKAGRERMELLGDLREVLDWHRLLYFKEAPDTTTVYLLALTSGAPSGAAPEICTRLGLAAGQREALLSLRENVRAVFSRLHAWQRRAGRTSELCDLLAPLPLEGLLYLMAKAHNTALGSAVSQYIYKWRQIKVDITGEDLRRMGLPPGPHYGEIMRLVLSARRDGSVETREAQLAMALGLVQATLRNMPNE